MRRARRRFLAGSAAALALGTEGYGQMSRIGQADLEAIEFEGRKYAQIMNGAALDLPQRTGYLSVIDIAAAELVALIRVYEVEYDPGLEADVQDVFFTLMELEADARRIVIENEHGERFALNLDGLSVDVLD